MAENWVLGIARIARPKSWPGTLAISVLAPALQACAVATPAAIISSTEEPIQKLSVQIQPEGEDSPHRIMFADALRQSFARRSVPVELEANIIVDYAFSVRQSGSGLVDAAAVTNAEQETIWVSPPRQPSRFDKCAAIRLRATLVMFRVRDGKIAYRGAAESDRCSVTDASAGELAEVLVSDALSKAANQPV